MTVRAPGEECLTNTQRMQRAAMAEFRGKEGLARTISDQQVAKSDPLKPPAKIEPAGKTDTRSEPAVSYGSRDSRYLDVTV